MKKIKINNPIVEMNGDEMARIMWNSIKETLIYPFLDIHLIYHDLSIQNRDITNDNVTAEAIKSIKQYSVGIKCATITPDDKRMKEFGIKNKLNSPNATIRNNLGGVIFREPILIPNISPIIHSWKKPIIIARHAYGDQYNSKNFIIPGKGILKMQFLSDQSPEYNIEKTIAYFPKKGGVAIGFYNFIDSIKEFANTSFKYALNMRYSVFLSTKNTILKEYDGLFKDIFKDIFNRSFKHSFKKFNLFYKHRLIDDMTAISIRSKGGFLWACKNYDGDVQSDMIAQGFGSLGLMTSTLIANNGSIIQTEAAHGTVTRHYRIHQAGQETSTNPIPLIFTWINGLRYRAKLDSQNHNETSQQNILYFVDCLKNAVFMTVQSGYVTKDLLNLYTTNNINKKIVCLTTKQLLIKIKLNLSKLLINHI